MRSFALFLIAVYMVIALLISLLSAAALKETFKNNLRD